MRSAIKLRQVSVEIGGSGGLPHNTSKDSLLNKYLQMIKGFDRQNVDPVGPRPDPRSDAQEQDSEGRAAGADPVARNLLGDFQAAPPPDSKSKEDQVALDAVKRQDAHPDEASLMRHGPKT